MDQCSELKERKGKSSSSYLIIDNQGHRNQQNIVGGNDDSSNYPPDYNKVYDKQCMMV